jgi:hypothetical protein
MTAAALSDELPFYDDPDECKPCKWCDKPMVRRNCTNSAYTSFRKRKTCSKTCQQRVRAGVYPGQQWGSLTTLYEVSPNISPKGKIENRWACQCICSERIFAQTKHLKRGNIKSCGCGGRIVPSQKFGMLTTIEKGKPGKNPNGSSYTTWQCVCACGTQVIVRAACLLKGLTTSCGCKTTTRLEDAVERSLNRLNVSYKKEHKPHSLAHSGFHYYLDFYLPEHKVNIEADGNTWHRDGNEYKSAEEQRAYDRYRNWWVQETLNCYVLRLSEDFLDIIHWRFLDNRLRLFLRSTLELSPKDRPWKRVIYDFE